MMLLLSLLAVAGAACATMQSYGTEYSASRLTSVENVVAFGDSYTDEYGLYAYFAYGGATPPPATNTTGNNVTASGGYAWGHVATQLLGAQYYDYAVKGAVCSNEIVSRFLVAINRTFPAVLDDEIPSFLADVAYVNESTGTNTFYTNRRSDNTVYALWIGTNDLGHEAFLTDTQKTGLTITNFIECIWEVFDNIYKSGGRHFVLLNQAPLERSPLYAAPQNLGVGDNHYWLNKTSYNMTEYELKIKEYTTNVNTVFDYGVPAELKLRARWPEATFAVFNTYQLLLDIINTPETYLDSPANVTGFYNHCDLDGTNCVPSENSPSTFLWYDELHPSARASEIIGQEFARAILGHSTYAAYW